MAARAEHFQPAVIVDEVLAEIGGRIGLAPAQIAAMARQQLDQRLFAPAARSRRRDRDARGRKGAGLERPLRHGPVDAADEIARRSYRPAVRDRPGTPSAVRRPDWSCARSPSACSANGRIARARHCSRLQAASIAKTPGRTPWTPPSRQVRASSSSTRTSAPSASMAEAFAADRVAPNALDWDREPSFPGRRDPRDRPARLRRHLCQRRCRRLRPRPARRGADLRGAVARLPRLLPPSSRSTTWRRG